MQSNYDRALKLVLAHEGGWSDHPKDPGGATMRGVTQRVYDAYRRRRGLKTQSVRQIADAELQSIYREQYADKVRFDELPDGVDYAVFDAAVNSGPGQAAKWLQRALGVEADGQIGNVTLDAARRANPVTLIETMCDQRMRFLRQLEGWPTFGRGWTARVAGVRSGARAMASGHAPVTLAPVDAAVPVTPAKASPADVAKPSAPVVGPTIGSAAGAVAVALEAARQQLTPLAASSALVQHILVYLTIAASAVAVAGVVYGVWAKLRRDAIKEATGGAA